MSIGWMDTLAEADYYFFLERTSSKAWDALANDAVKTRCLNNAYNRLYYHPDYALPTYAAATAAELVILKKANCEMAEYLARHLADEDRRKGLHAQGVIKAGIVKEDYSEDMLKEVPIPPFVDALLDKGGFKTAGAFGIVDIERDEDEGVNEKVDDF